MCILMNIQIGINCKIRFSSFLFLKVLFLELLCLLNIAQLVAEDLEWSSRGHYYSIRV